MEKYMQIAKSERLGFARCLRRQNSGFVKLFGTPFWNGCFTFFHLIGISSHDAGPLAVQCDSQAGSGSDDAGPGSRVHVGTNAAAAEISDQQERARTDASSQPAAQNVRIGHDWAGLASRPALRQVGLRQTDIGLLPSYDCSRPQSRRNVLPLISLAVAREWTKRQS